MGRRRIRALALSAIVTAGALSWATTGHARPDPDSTADVPAALPAAAGLGDECDPLLEADLDATPRRLIGQVTSLDRAGGRLMLATRSGAVALHASSETMNELAVGDVIVLELTAESDAVVSRHDCP